MQLVRLGEYSMASNNKKVKQTLTLFIITFLVSLIVITYFIKSFSPNVDVEIGGESDEQQYVEENSESDVKKAIDDRLRWIQLEDNMPGAAKRNDEQNGNEITYESEKVKKHKENIDTSLDTSDVDTEQQQELKPIEYVGPEHTSAVPPVPAPQKAEPPKMSKVYVGSYPTIEQAIQAQNNLMNVSSSISPFVKEVNGSYVLQAGSYASPNKAEAVSREINSLGFHARVVKE